MDSKFFSIRWRSLLSIGTGINPREWLRSPQPRKAVTPPSHASMTRPRLLNAAALGGSIFHTCVAGDISLDTVPVPVLYSNYIDI